MNFGPWLAPTTATAMATTNFDFSGLFHALAVGTPLYLPTYTVSTCQHKASLETQRAGHSARKATLITHASKQKQMSTTPNEATVLVPMCVRCCN